MGLRQGRHFFSRFGLHRFIFRLAQDVNNDLPDLFHLSGREPLRGQGWRAKADAGGIERLSLVKGDDIFVDGDVRPLERRLGDGAGDAEGRDIEQKQMIIRSAGDHGDIIGGERFRQGLSIGYDLVAICFELIGGRFK